MQPLTGAGCDVTFCRVFMGGQSSQTRTPPGESSQATSTLSREALGVRVSSVESGEVTTLALGQGGGAGRLLFPRGSRSPSTGSCCCWPEHTHRELIPAQTLLRCSSKCNLTHALTTPTKYKGHADSNSKTFLL